MKIYKNDFDKRHLSPIIRLTDKISLFFSLFEVAYASKDTP